MNEKELQIKLCHWIKGEWLALGCNQRDQGFPTVDTQLYNDILQGRPYSSWSKVRHYKLFWINMETHAAKLIRVNTLTRKSPGFSIFM